MKGQAGPAYNPAHYTRAYDRELVRDHVGECLELYHELAESHGIPDEIAVSVFGIIQTMVVAVEPVAGTPSAARANGLVAVEGAEAARFARER